MAVESLIFHRLIICPICPSEPTGAVRRRKVLKIDLQKTRQGRVSVLISVARSGSSFLHIHTMMFTPVTAHPA
ncbi:hypothetical protein Dda3937_04545 [Dickeya dadantii 3937]|uniref:Uncharacterized protein n=1 Tax=Dickeya dadantii (strain 3937) TaxID=198628 RepID=E0SLV9_DICD3|nr:hypothetical protein Dda3937_04545 [Dickeya dadantii 3937]